VEVPEIADAILHEFGDSKNPRLQRSY